LKILIIDDDRIVCQALKTILEEEAGFVVAALGSSYEEALQLYQEHRPDILLMDIRMGQKTGLQAAEAILGRHPDAKILFLTTFADDEYILKALQLGAKGYLIKQDFEAIAPALRAVASGQTVFGSEVMRALPPLLKPSQGKPLEEGLSDREHAVLQLIAEGLSNREIAEQLFLSEGTVRNYVSQLLAKLDVRDRTQLVVRYYRGQPE